MVKVLRFVVQVDGKIGGQCLVGFLLRILAYALILAYKGFQFETAHR